MRLLIIAAILLSGVFTKAQSRERYPVKSGESPAEVIPFKAQFLLPAFKKGNAYMHDGTHAYQDFNYSRLLGEVMFIAPAGDTLAIAEPKEIDYIQVDSIIFYYNKGYLRQIEKAGSYKLVVKEQLMEFPDKVEGAYGTTSGNYAVTTYSNLYVNNSKMTKLTVKRDVVFSGVQFFFIGDQYNHFYKADKKGFADLFPNKKDTMVEYIKNEKLNLNNAEDITKLFRFCTAN